MNINRENYEAYFLDYHERRLSPDEIAVLLLFLEYNPDLKKIFHEFESLALDKDAVVFEDKDILKKETFAFHPDKLQECIFAWLEGELPNEQTKAFENYLSLHPEVNKEIDLYRKTFLNPDKKLVLENKQNLKKTIHEITPGNYEEYFIASQEGILNTEEENRVQEFILHYPSYKNEYQLFGHVKLSATEVIVFEDKEKLRQIPFQKKKTLYYYIGAAASALLLFGIYFTTKQAEPLITYNNNYGKQEYRTAPAVIQQPPAEAIKMKLPAASSGVSDGIVSWQATRHSNPSSLPANALALLGQAGAFGVINSDVATSQTFSPANQKAYSALNERKKKKFPEMEFIQATSVRITSISSPEINRDIVFIPEKDFVISPTDLKEEENTTSVAANETKEYLTLKETIIKKLKTKLYRDNPERTTFADVKKITIWDAAYAGAKGLGKVTGKNYDVRIANSKKDGHIQYSLIAGEFEISQ